MRANSEIILSGKKTLKKLKAQDRALYKIGKKIEILDRLKWPISVKKKFLKNWRNKTPALPRVTYPDYRLDSEKNDLKEIMAACKGKDPLARMISRAAGSYLTALRMLENTGKKRFLTLSTRLYGVPKEPFEYGGSITTLRAAQHILKESQKFNIGNIIPEETICIMPDYVANRIAKTAKRVFGHDEIEVIVDPKLTSKASASSKRIRVRGSTCFASQDIDQLIHHELLVHSLTLSNGRAQPLKTLGLNSPRITCSQEGLAVFAEFITNSIDIARLRRISARVRAVQMGIDGADFIDVFKFFLDQGQSQAESYYSTVRIFRGGKITGGIVFTKDVAYLKGFIEVHRFFLESLQNEDYLFPLYFFAGRMCTEDVTDLKPYFEAGLLKLPVHLPEWVKNRSTLLAFLLSSSVMNSLGLSNTGKKRRKSSAKLLSRK